MLITMISEINNKNGGLTSRKIQSDQGIIKKDLYGKSKG